ncbi:hypothetical protein B0I35DRAFT_437327 [Stachybotrys elegans]|uniref:Uncharacterized protein n=1 Tax=Stachybotrys elegans TaxID=80388 RepID=A0A8K0SMU9_9HYPO|nr:hypothetical protein B0I35DRAFT_437327 [Stachybotrys elegans]
MSTPSPNIGGISLVGAGNKAAQISENARHEYTPRQDEAIPMPGIRAYQGRGGTIEDAQDLVQFFSALEIPCCMIDVRALKYYGAARVAQEWDVCIPSSSVRKAVRILEDSSQYEPAKPCCPNVMSLRHVNPTFVRVGTGFFFVLRPSSQCFVDPRPEFCELSMNGIPYPQMAPFGRSLLVMQCWADLADFIDGMDLDEKWGDENIDFADLQVKGREFTDLYNAELRKFNLNQYSVVDYRQRWIEIVETKARRIEPMKQGRYKTRWRRIKNDRDPRTREHVKT